MAGCVYHQPKKWNQQVGGGVRKQCKGRRKGASGPRTEHSRAGLESKQSWLRCCSRAGLWHPGGECTAQLQGCFLILALLSLGKISLKP